MKKRLFKKIKTVNKENVENNLPYEQRESVKALSMVVTIVNRNQFRYFVDAYQNLGASMTSILYSYSMPPEEYRTLLGTDQTKKEILLTFCRSEDASKLLEVAKERFKISPMAKGIAFVCPIDSVGGIATYKFLADHNKETRESKNGSK